MATPCVGDDRWVPGVGQWGRVESGPCKKKRRIRSAHRSTVSSLARWSHNATTSRTRAARAPPAGADVPLPRGRADDESTLRRNASRSRLRLWPRYLNDIGGLTSRRRCWDGASRCRSLADRHVAVVPSRKGACGRARRAGVRHVLHAVDDGHDEHRADRGAWRGSLDVPDLHPQGPRAHARIRAALPSLALSRAVPDCRHAVRRQPRA